MKKLLIFLIVTACSLSACDSDEEQQTIANTEEVSLLIATSVSTNTYGLNALLEESAAMQQAAISGSGGRVDVCDYSETGTYEVSSADNSIVSFAYDFSYDAFVNCSAIQIPTSVSVDFDYSGNFDGPKLSWSHSGIGAFDITMNNDQNLVYNGTYDRSGMYNIKANENFNGSSSVDLTITNVILDAETKAILSGTGAYEIDVNRNNRNYTVSGAILFNGNDSATLLINGSEVTFNLVSGSINE